MFSVSEQLFEIFHIATSYFLADVFAEQPVGFYQKDDDQDGKNDRIG